MKKALALFMATAMFAPSAFAAEITPYIGLGLVIDKANTTAKRVGFNPTPLTGLMAPNADIASIMSQAFVQNGGSEMAFDMAFAGEITAGIKYGNVRGELEVAVRSASEDDYDIFDGNIVEAIVGTPIANIPTEIENSISVRHNSYLANVYYDFELENSKWTPYIGAGVGFGVYRQKATVEIDIDEVALANLQEPIKSIVGGVLSKIPAGEMEVANDTLYEFEWQVGLGAVYNFNEDWAVDVGYRFNSSTVADEFVYAHEIKLGARYSF